MRPAVELAETGWRGRAYLSIVGELVEQDQEVRSDEVAAALSEKPWHPAPRPAFTMHAPGPGMGPPPEHDPGFAQPLRISTSTTPPRPASAPPTWRTR